MSIRSKQRAVIAAQKKVEWFQDHFDAHRMTRRKRAAFARALQRMQAAEMDLADERMRHPAREQKMIMITSWQSKLEWLTASYHRVALADSSVKGEK